MALAGDLCRLALFGGSRSINAASVPVTIRVGYPQLNGGQIPVWNIPEHDQKYGLDIKPVYIPGGVRLTQSAVSGAVDIAMTGAAAVNALLSGADFIYVGMPVPTYAFSLYARPEIKEVADLRGKVLGVITKGASSDKIKSTLRFKISSNDSELGVLCALAKVYSSQFSDSVHYISGSSEPSPL